MSKRVFKTELDAVNNSLQSQVNNSISKTIVDAKGDIVTASAADTPIRLAVGTNEHRLVADSATTSGLKYVADTTNYAVGAKGDLLVGTAADTVSALTVGANGDTLVADSSATTGLRWQGNYSAGKNKIINGDFGIWQRGTSFTPGLGNYTADRFAMYTEGSGSTRTVSQQTFTPGTAPVAGYEGRYFFRYAQTVGPSANIGNNLIMHRVEGVRTLAGQTVTFSFWAKAASAMTLGTVYAYQVFGTGGTPSGNVQADFATNISIGTSWARYSYTVTIPSISGKTIGTNNDDYIDFRLQLPLNSGATFTFDTWGWQVEAGSIATPFTTATGNPAGELAACQRYFQIIADGTGQSISMLAAYNSTNAYGVYPSKVTMRTTPTIYQVSGTNYFLILGNNLDNDVFDSVTALENASPNAVRFSITSGISMTQGYSYWFQTNNASARLGLQAEL